MWCINLHHLDSLWCFHYSFSLKIGSIWHKWIFLMTIFTRTFEGCCHLSNISKEVCRHSSAKPAFLQSHVKSHLQHIIPSTLAHRCTSILRRVATKIVHHFPKSCPPPLNLPPRSKKSKSLTMWNAQIWTWRNMSSNKMKSRLLSCYAVRWYIWPTLDNCMRISQFNF